MSWLSRDQKNGIALTKKCLKILFTQGSLRTFVIMSILTNSLILLAVLYCEYLNYGIHIFDFTTLTAILHTDFWDHVIHFLALSGVFVLTSMITIRYKLSTTFYTITLFKKGRPSFFKALFLHTKNTKEFLRYALIFSIEHLKMMLSFFDPMRRLEQFEDYLDGTQTEHINKYARKNSFLLVPVLVENMCHISTAENTSKKLLQKNFGQDFKFHFAFNKLHETLEFIVLLISFIVFHFIIGFHVFPGIIFSLSVTMLFNSILGNAKLIFRSAIYNYCKGHSTGPFSEAEIEKLFSKK